MKQEIPCPELFPHDICMRTLRPTLISSTRKISDVQSKANNLQADLDEIEERAGVQKECAGAIDDTEELRRECQELQRQVEIKEKCS